MANKLSFKHRILAAAGAVTMAAAVVITGTFAWQSISQMANNETVVPANPGARLHDDFDGRNKDVYVENFTDPNDGGMPIFARIRLDEYMEIGSGAGLKTGDAGYADKKAQSLISGADINDVTTWTTHIPANDPAFCAKDFHTYWHWDMGGKTVYMPTFNKNKDSLKADVNGTFAGTNPADNVHYDDYHKYALGETKVGDEIYDADDNKIDEGAAAVEGVNIRTVQNQTHTARETHTATVVTMAQWKAMGSPVGKYWVYDVDGWAYWAEALKPGEATGLLLDAIELVRDPDDDCYYAINVVGQFTTRGDWGQNDNSGFFDPTQGTPPTNDAMDLLRQAADMLPGVTGITMAEGAKAYVRAGNAITLHPVVTVKNPSGDVAETNVKWDVSPATNMFLNGTLSTTEAMTGKTYRVTATSTFDTNYSAFTDVYVYPADAEGVVPGQNDGKLYVKYPDNTYKEILSDGSLGDFICAGLDEIIGNGDDKEPVIVLNPANAQYGDKFLGPNPDDSYYAKGPDGKLGTADDIKVWLDPDWSNLTTQNPDELVKADQVIISVDGDTRHARYITLGGTTIQFSAVVKLSGAPIGNQKVHWRVMDRELSNVIESDLIRIDENGLLSFDGSYEDVPFEFCVQAIADADSTARAFNFVSFINEPEIIRIDNVDFYILRKNVEGKSLIYAKDAVATHVAYHQQQSTMPEWKDSDLRNWLNGEWLDSMPTLKTIAEQTTIYTRKTYNIASPDTSDPLSLYSVSNDYAFCLSSADLYGASAANPQGPYDYTYRIDGEGVRLGNANGDTSYYAAGGLPLGVYAVWLRNPSITDNCIGISYGITGNEWSLQYYNGGDDAWPVGVRPALWVDLNSL